jgi:hypothetical protein
MESDEIFRTARQVRLPGWDTIHDLAGTTTTTEGRIRRTGCGETAPAHLAVLTTRPANCGKCDRVKLRGLARQRELTML